MRVEVTRGLGDLTGPEINDSLIATEGAARERGRIEVDRNSTSRELVGLVLPLQPWLAPGALVEIQDAEGGSWRGLLTSWQVVYSRAESSVTAETALNIEREAT